MLQDNNTPHDKFINRQILDEFEWMVDKFIAAWLPEDIAKARVIKIQKDKYNKIK